MGVAKKVYGGLEGLLGGGHSTKSSSSSKANLRVIEGGKSDKLENLVNENSSSKEGFVSKALEYLPHLVTAYALWESYKSISDMMGVNNNNNNNNIESSITPTDKSASMFQGMAMKGLQLIVAGYMAAGAYDRLHAAKEFYENEAMHDYDLTHEHLKGLAYALAYGEQPPANIDYLNQNFIYNTTLRALQLARVDKLDQTAIGSKLIRSLLETGEKMSEEIGGSQMRVIEKVKKSARKSSKAQAA
ncbi:MAG: hypothetical protein ACLFPL_03695 [Candidatus Nanoarchaeia archaeon]